MTPRRFAALAAAVELARLAFLYRLPDARLVGFIPDDAFYYLVLARNFAAHGRWTFDGTAPASGFHLLWAYLLAAFYFVAPRAGLHAVFLAGSLAQIACLALAAGLTAAAARRLYGTSALPGVALIFFSACVLLLPTFLMESTWVMAAAAGLVYFLAGEEVSESWKLAAGMFALGLLGMLARSDFGLLPLWLSAAHLRHTRSWRRARAATAALAGSCAGLVTVVLHAHFVSGHWAQASAAEKLHWARVEGFSFGPALRVVYGLFNPLTNSPFTSLFLPKTRPTLLHDWIRHAGGAFRALLILALLAGLVAACRRWRPSAWPRTLTASLALTAISYLCLYRFDSAALQIWYVANFSVPLALLAGAAFTAIPKMRPAAVGVAAACCVLGVSFSFWPCYPWQEAMYRAGNYVAAHPELGTVGAWNAGLVQYYSGGRVVNLDGLVNDDILPYSVQGTLASYVRSRGIATIIDTPYMFAPNMAARGGYADGRLFRCLDQATALFPDDPLNDYVGTHITLYRVNPVSLQP